MEAAEQALREIRDEFDVENRGYITITDLSGLGMGAMMKKKATAFLANTAGDNYPELIDKVYLVNAPWIFEKIFGFIKPMLNAETVAKFRVHSGIPKVLTEVLDKAMLPEEFGGDRKITLPFPKDCKKFDEELLIFESRIE